MNVSITGILKIINDKQGQPYLSLDIPTSDYFHSATSWLAQQGLDLWLSNRDARDGEHFHLTVLNVMEWQRSLKRNDPIIEALIIEATNETSSYLVDLYGIGHGQSPKTGSQAYFVVAQCEALQHLRSQLQLSPKELHITLAFEPKDIFDVSKGLGSVAIPNNVFVLNSISPTM